MNFTTPGTPSPRVAAATQAGIAAVTAAMSQGLTPGQAQRLTAAIMADDVCPLCGDAMGEWERDSDTLGRPIPHQRVRCCTRLGCYVERESTRPGRVLDLDDPFDRQALTPGISPSYAELKYRGNGGGR